MTATLDAVAITANLIGTPAARRVHDSARLLAWRRPAAVTILRAEIAAAAWPARTPGNGDPPARSSDTTSRTERAVLTRLGDEEERIPRFGRFVWVGRAGPADALEQLDVQAAVALTAVTTAHDHWQRARLIHAGEDWARVSDVFDALVLVDDWTHAAHVALREGHDICTRHMPARDPRQRWRCRGDGDAEGSTCENVADYRIKPDGTRDDMDGRCPDCRASVIAKREAERREREAARQRRHRHRKSA